MQTYISPLWRLATFVTPLTPLTRNKCSIAQIRASFTKFAPEKLKSKIPTVKRDLRIVILLALIMANPTAFMKAQCIVINEIMVNPSGLDGVPPNTNEWIELINTCNAPTDISCMIVSDGDFSLTIPSGTVLQPNEIFTIGSGQGGNTPDLNWTTCNCSSSINQTGSLTDASEQFFVLDATGSVLSGVYWGGGTFPASVSSIAANGCPAVTGISVSLGPEFQSITITEGISNELSCNGSYITSGSSSFGSTNSDQIPSASITPSVSVVCQGFPMNFSSTGSVGNVSS
ncbi:MAG: hypothetical protein RL040_101, partial [Bacteroidota bacterium]